MLATFFENHQKVNTIIRMDFFSQTVDALTLFIPFLSCYLPISHLVPFMPTVFSLCELKFAILIISKTLPNKAKKKHRAKDEPVYTEKFE